MSDLLKKGFHLGLGAAISGKERFEKMVNEMVKSGEISPSQAKTMVNNWMSTWISKGETKDKEWNEQAKVKFQDQMKELGFVSKEEYEKLEARVQKLENLYGHE
ncbi:Polyhydroxyalkanoate synthesis regulator phasin [Halobacillus karajensis]|uniref:Polyhydroxyalkanoate synthesis regulator phasin n=1 Tax=Halobacillus karajensis TaxID=195088 RepID=A0A024P3T0_9BACI|nr:hypothetical protein [Halobacillus karajensis]CDQ18768.1 hypothetical protein BN982_01049 [Halobacillus karajensis]CDQ23160.1 hypothetical protein BN983_01379 [Halobacillus karajensis]CDQ26642.1 hypothetical protein BN981_00859 [Halobacillus karajensis]SEH46482.1 Polyhydroxyalkanoate synthesis regulator phasin [Halobacillus karajensis]